MNSMPPPYFPPPIPEPKNRNNTLIVLIVALGLFAIASTSVVGALVITNVFNDKDSGPPLEEREESRQLEGFREAWENYDNADRLVICEVVNDLGPENVHEVLGEEAPDIKPEVAEQFFREVC